LRDRTQTGRTARVPIRRQATLELRRHRLSDHSATGTPGSHKMKVRDVKIEIVDEDGSSGWGEAFGSAPRQHPLSCRGRGDVYTGQTGLP
jgi:L-alanine-DL-glutamate epimerase-like enolase superfamily enzyme